MQIEHLSIKIAKSLTKLCLLWLFKQLMAPSNGHESSAHLAKFRSLHLFPAIIIRIFSSNKVFHIPTTNKEFLKRSTLAL